MPPRLATEIGFATYLNPSEIQKLVADTSMRIFILPGECELKGLDTADMLVMDLNAPVRGTAPEDMGKLLNRWNKMPWDKRQVAMEKVFADTAATFNDKNLFIQRSGEFLDQAEAWEKGGWVEKGTFTTLEELKAKYESLPLCAQIPWMRDAFIARVPLMMKEKGAIHKLTGQALAAWRIGKDESAKEIYEFGLAMGGTNTRAMADTARELTEKLVAPELAAERQRTAKAIADGEAAVAQAKAEGEAAVAAATAAGAAAVAAEQEKTAQAVAAGEAEAARIKAEGDAAVAAATAAGAAAVAAEVEKQEQLKAVAAEKIKTERDAHAATQQKLDAETAAHAATQQQLTAAQQECETAKAERDGLNQRLERAKTAYTDLKKAKAEVDQQLSGVDAKLAEAQKLQEEAEALRAEADKAKAKADKVVNENNKRMVIFAAAGFLVAALIFGVILLVMGLGKDKPAEETTLPTETMEVTEASTEAPTEAPTEEPTEAPTEAPTEPTDPDLTVWTDDAAALWLMEQVEGIDMELEPAEVPEALAAVEGYVPVAAIRLAETEGEDVAYLLQKSAGDLAGDERVLENETKPDGEENPTEPEDSVLTAVEVEDALAVLTSEEFVLVVYGDQVLEKALEVYGLIVPQDQEILTRWTVAEAPLDVDGMMAELLADQQWWRGLKALVLDAGAMSQVDVKETPAAEFVFESGSVYLFIGEKEALAEALNEELLQAGHFTAVDGTLVALMPVTQE